MGPICVYLIYILIQNLFKASMSERRIYQALPFKVGDELDLSESASLHLGQVLRLKVGDRIILFNGNNHEYEAVIKALQKKKVAVLIVGDKPLSRESPRKIHLLQGLSKSDKMDTVVQKAVELGVFSITPIITAHCAVKLDWTHLKKKWKHWQGIAIAACEQCGRNFIPHIYEPLSLHDYLESKSAGFHLVL